MDEEDDFGFLTPGRSRLSNLFPSSNVSEEDVNQSLTYVAPKQPKKNAPENPSGGSGGGANLQLIQAVAAYTYKLDGGKYVNVGKLGVAVLGDKDAGMYKLLLYKGKQQHVTICSITASFEFAVEPNNYAKFPDDKGEQWSVMFESETQLISFAKQVALAKANSTGKVPGKLIVQDLIAGDGHSVGGSDAVDIEYTGWLFKDFGFGDVFDENVKKDKQFIVRLGKTKVIKGMAEGIVGAKKGMRRLLIIPPDLAYGAEGVPNLVPPNSALIFEIFFKKVKIVREASDSPSPSRKGSEVKPEVPPRTQSISDDSIRSRGASISEQLTQSPRKDNAKLISRMAKMGMPTLPMHGAVAAQTSSESEPEKDHEPDQYQTRKPSAPSPKPVIGPVQGSQRDIEYEEEVYAQRKRNLPTPKPSSPQLQITSMPYTAYSTSAFPMESAAYLHQPLQSHPITPVMPTVIPTSMLESHIPLLVTETRTQNTEVRLALGKISDKVDTVIQKLDDGRFQQGASAPFHGQVPYMESSVLAQNIERIIQENTQLKKENETKSSKIQELNEKICEILQRNQRFFEESNSILEQRSDSLQMTTSQLQNKILTLEQEKAKLSTEVSELMSKCSSSESKAGELEKKRGELENELTVSENRNRELKDELTSLKEKCNENELVIQKLRKGIEEMKQRNEQLNEKVSEAEDALRSARESEENLRSQMGKTESTQLQQIRKELQSETEKAAHWKKKYETLHENARVLKEKYESQIISMVSEMKKLKVAAAQQKAPVQMSQDFSSEIKKAMNILYKLLRNEVNASETYTGSDVLKLSLAVIQRVTLTLIERGQQPSEKAMQSKIVSEGPAPGGKGDAPSVAAEVQLTESPHNIQDETSDSQNVQPEPKEPQNQLEEPQNIQTVNDERNTSEEQDASKENVCNSEVNAGVNDSSSTEITEKPPSPDEGKIATPYASCESTVGATTGNDQSEQESVVDSTAESGENKQEPAVSGAGDTGAKDAVPETDLHVNGATVVKDDSGVPKEELKADVRKDEEDRKTPDCTLMTSLTQNAVHRVFHFLLYSFHQPRNCPQKYMETTAPSTTSL